MEDHVFKRLRSDPQVFEPADGHRAIRASGFRRAPQVAEYHEEVIAEQSIAAWLDASSPKRLAHDPQSPPGQNEQWNLRLLLCSPRILDRALWPLPLSGGTFDLLMRRWDIPSVFFKAIRRQVPIATAFEDPDDDDKSVLLLRTNISWTWQYALAATYDATTRTTSVLIIGLRADEASIVTEALKSCLSFGGCPMLLPCILIDKCVDSVAEDAEHRRDSLIKICYSTGLHGFTTTASSALGDDRDDPDLDALISKLTSLTDACAGITSVCQTQRRFIDAISTFNDLSTSSSSNSPTHTMSSSPTTAYKRPPRGAQSCATRLSFTSELLQGIESKISYAKASAQGQVQTMYSLIGQRDNRTNAQLADASRRIAEDGRRVALLTRRDSTDMRIVAAVTLIFLPATFTATFFSTSFFDFGPGAGGGGSSASSNTNTNTPTTTGNSTARPSPTAFVSDWIWLYWVVTAVLTMVVLSTWIVLVRAQHLKTAVALRRESRREEELARRLRGRATGFTVVNSGGANEIHDPLRPYLAGVPDLQPERVFGEKWSQSA